MSTPANWHEVVPKIVDPDLAPQGVGLRRGLAPQHNLHGAAPGQQGGFGPQGQPPGYPPYGGFGPEKPRGFFQEHKFAIIVAVVVLAVVLVVLYLYLSQKGKRSDKGAKGRPPPGGFGAGAGDGGDGPGASEEEKINSAEMQKAFMMRQAARAAQQRARRQNDGAEPEGFGGPRDPWQGGGADPQMAPPFDPSYPPYGAFGPRTVGAAPVPARGAPMGREDGPPGENAGPWGQAPPSGQPFNSAQPRGPPSAPYRPADPPQPPVPANGPGPATAVNPGRVGFPSAVDVVGPAEQRRVTWAEDRTKFFDGGRGGTGAPFVDGRGARAPRTAAAPEKVPTPGDNNSGGLFQQLATSLEDEASSGQ